MFKQGNTGRFDRSFHLLSIIRLLICTGQGITIFYFSVVNDIGLHLVPLITLLLLMCLFSIISWLRIKSTQNVNQQLFFIHLSVDMLALAFMLYFSGGASNPFISYLLVPIAIGSSVLRWNYSLFLALLGLVSYSLLLFFYHPVHALMSHTGSNGLSLHLLGMWLNFVVSASLIAYFIVRMAHTIRRQHEELSKSKEKQLETDRLIAVATLAANTAHQLGTPINSISLLANELNETRDNEKNSNSDLEQTVLSDLQTQVTRCKQTLQNLINTADKALEERDQKVKAGEYLQDILERWHVIHPEQLMDINHAALADLDCMLNIPLSLEPVIFNLLNNAAQSGGNRISIDFNLINNPNGISICMQIKDNGKGIPDIQKEQLGSPFNSSKIDGMGIGLYLAFSTIESLGGELRFESEYSDLGKNRQANETVGTNVSLTLPAELN